MAQYESGQYINEFLDNMPNLLLTMRKMDVDQMLKTRRLDQIDIGQNLDQERFNFDSLIKDRQMSVLEAESGISLEERAEAKRGRKAWRDIKGPLTKDMLQGLQLGEEYDEQIKNMGFWEQVFRPRDEDFLGIKSERTIATEAAEEKYGERKKPSKLFEEIRSISGELTPPQFMDIYTDPNFQPRMLGKTGLMGLTTAGLVGGQYP
jgi:hypothetical protein